MVTKLCIFENANAGQWILQNKNNSRLSLTRNSLRRLVADGFEPYLDQLRLKFDASFVEYKQSQIEGYIKNMTKQFGVCYIDFPGDLFTGEIDKTIDIRATNTNFIFYIK